MLIFLGCYRRSAQGPCRRRPRAAPRRTRWKSWSTTSTRSTSTRIPPRCASSRPRPAFPRRRPRVVISRSKIWHPESSPQREVYPHDSLLCLALDYFSLLPPQCKEMV
ncbi:HOPX isoform 1 [Pongo abelii]|uniref:HOPX isoform 1 n=1 Tax=Pongo abelii TaxID=9601 RepID=A0A2J8S2I9_PONAB|nr:HOPX isoform 1 [Pongo abelii]